MDPLTFAQGLLARGIEFQLRGRLEQNLHVWPYKAWKHLTADERRFITAHEAELTDLTRAKVLPETSVKWVAPNANAPNADGTTAAATPIADCPYCQRPCVGESHELYATLHWRDPKQIAKRNAEATAVMKRTAGWSSPY
jgi:hypothetical protein